MHSDMQVQCKAITCKVDVEYVVGLRTSGTYKLPKNVHPKFFVVGNERPPPNFDSYVSVPSPF